MRALLVAAGALALAACSGSDDVPRACPGPRPGWRAAADSYRGEIFDLNRVSIGSDNAIRWNGVRIDRPTLRKYMRAGLDQRPMPFVILDPGGSPDCAFLQSVRNDMEGAYPCRNGSCGEGGGPELK